MSPFEDSRVRRRVGLLMLVLLGLVGSVGALHAAKPEESLQVEAAPKRTKPVPNRTVPPGLGLSTKPILTAGGKPNPETLAQQGPVRSAVLQLPFFSEPEKVEYTVVDGDAIFEGDINLGPEKDLQKNYPPLAEEPKRTAPNGSSDTSFRGAVIKNWTGTFRWPECRIPFTINSNVPQSKVSEIRAAIAELNKTQINLVQRRGEANYIEFKYSGDNGRCNSPVGRRLLRQRINIGGGCGTGSIMHEILHSAGAYHEQTRRDRDDFVRIDFDNVKKGHKHNFRKGTAITTLDIGPYDFGSIMHYDPFGFSKNNQATIVALNPLPAGVRMGQRVGLSDGDKETIRFLCEEKTVLKRHSYGRGAGKVPKDCPAGEVYDAGLCYPACKPGFTSFATTCLQSCPPGYRNDGLYCAKPKAYGRGAGYPWKAGDGLNLNKARKRCEKDHGQCEKVGAIIYPSCKAGFHRVGCCVCSPDCPAGFNDIGASCKKPSYQRGVGKSPRSCGPNMELENGLCYPKCNSGYNGQGPVCWENCRPGFRAVGAVCAAL